MADIEFRANTTAVEDRARAWMEDAFGAFHHSTTEIHSVPPDEVEATQLAAFNLRLAQRRAEIPVLARLAEAQAITEVESIEDAAKLFFTHDVYKSYPASLLVKSRFDQLIKWLDRLTPYDLGQVRTAGIGSIDAFLDTLRAETPLDTVTSSGTSGTLSFFPKSKKDFKTSVTMLRVELTQKYGQPPAPGAMEEPIHVLTPFYRDGYSTVTRLPHHFQDIFCKGDPALLHTALPFAASADLIWLGARLRAAQAQGNAQAPEVPPGLLARRAEWEQIGRDTPRLQSEFITRMIPELKGKRVFALGITGLFYQFALAGQAAGIKAEFAPGSIVMGGGGGKGVVLPDNVDDIIRDFFGVERIHGGYGMTEQNFYLCTCEYERRHLPPWVIAVLLDEDGKPLPRSGQQAGRATFFDISLDGAWGGVVTGDKIAIDYTPCKCGRTTFHVDKKIQRFSEITGDDDKITCAATPAAQSAALDLLNTL